jgi:hypothetical protein
MLIKLQTPRTVATISGGNRYSSSLNSSYCVLLILTRSVTEYTASTVESLLNGELTRIWKWLYLIRYNPKICLDGIRQNEENVSHYPASQLRYEAEPQEQNSETLLLNKPDRYYVIMRYQFC